MTLCLALSNMTLQPGLFVADLCATAHERRLRGVASAEVRTKTATKTEVTRYRLTFDQVASSAKLDVQREKRHQVIALPKRIVEFDPTSMQYTERARNSKSLAEALHQSSMPLDDLVCAIPDPDAMAKWLAALLNQGTWRFVNSTGVFGVTSRSSTGEVTVAIDPATHLVVAASILDSGFGSTWTFRYGSTDETIEFRPPKGAYRTSEMSILVKPPKFASAEAKRLTQEIFALYDRPRSLAYEVVSGPDTSRVAILNGNVACRERDYEWTLVDGTLTVIDNRAKRVRTGRAGLLDTIEVLAQEGKRVEPLLLPILRGFNPFRLYMGQGATVTVKGQTKVGNEVCTILDATSKVSRVSLVVRNRDGFVLSLANLTLGLEPGESMPRQFTRLTPVRAFFETKAPPGYARESLVIQKNP